MRRIAAVTVGRSDYGIYRPIFERVLSTRGLELGVLASGTHLRREFGLTVRDIEADGFPVRARVPALSSVDGPGSIARAMGRAAAGFASAYAASRPDMLLVLGDRYEMHAAALAALPFNIPVAHIQGGELTLGAFDDALRHSITKLSHLHFVSTGIYARRVRQLGEEAWRVVVCGAPGLDNLRSVRLLEPAEISRRYGLSVEPKPLLVTFHPVTLEVDRLAWQVSELLGALDDSGLPLVFTMPNADTRGSLIRSRVRAFVSRRPLARAVEDMGTQGYFSLMARAAAMVGNSSSGIIEAPSFGLPVVNVGNRQQGRLRAENVIDVGYSRGEIRAGLRRALAPGLRERLSRRRNPYGDGKASSRIVRRLKNISLDRRLLAKRFVDIPVPSRPS